MTGTGGKRRPRRRRRESGTKPGRACEIEKDIDIIHVVRIASDRLPEGLL